MARFVSGQDDANPALWLATPAGKMAPSRALGTTRCVPQQKFSRKPYNKSVIDWACLVNMAGYWTLSFFWWAYGPRLHLGPSPSPSRDQYPAILASRLVDKPVYYMASSASGQNEPNSALWLASSGLPAVSGEKNFPESQIINPLLTKLFRSRWLDVGLVL